ncbi:MAG: amino acid ABC transporter ATP-binding protein [Verrucomicrobiae bacterium]|nr:amino acid ABC transporter ATP-binding protein [Verrucomicrobiae bacterium]
MRLRLRELAKHFDRHAVLDGVDLELTETRALVLIGPSGGGKSTLLRLLGGLEHPSAGWIELDGAPIPFESPAELHRHRARTGFVFQAHNLFPHLPALQNITLPLERVHGLAPGAARDQAMELLVRFRLEAHAAKRPAQLSGGQQQRVAIARAVAIRPRWLLLDEPTSALDPEMTAEVLDMIAELRAEGRDIVLVTHQMGFARRVADHIAFVGDGGIPAHGPVAEMLDHPTAPQVRRFLDRVLSY